MYAVYTRLIVWTVVLFSVSLSFATQFDDFKYPDEKKSQLGPQADAYAMGQLREFTRQHTRANPDKKIPLSELRGEYQKAKQEFVQRWQPFSQQTLQDPNRHDEIQKHCRQLVVDVWKEVNRWSTEKSSSGAPRGTHFLDGSRKLSDFVDKVVYDRNLKGDASYKPVYDPKQNKYVRTIFVGPDSLKGRGRAGQFLVVAHEIYHAVCFQDQVRFAKDAIQKKHPNMSKQEVERLANRAISNPKEGVAVYYKEERLAERWARAFCNAMIPGGLPASLKNESKDYVSGYSATMQNKSSAESETLTLLSAYARALRALRRSLGLKMGTNSQKKSRRMIGTETFQQSIQGEPVFGGIVLGNRASDTRCLPKQISFRTQDETIIVVVEVEVEGRIIECEYRPGSMTDLWAAYHIVQPLEEWQIELGLDGSESSLVSMEQNTGNGAVNFALHPALIYNETGRTLALADTMFALSPPGLFENINVTLTAAQWHDVEPTFRVIDGRLIVEAASGPPEVLVRPSFWSMVNYEAQDMRVAEEQAEQFVHDHLSLVGHEFLEILSKNLDPNREGTDLHMTPEEFMQDFQENLKVHQQRQPYSDMSRLVTAFHHYQCLQDMNAFAQTLAVLNWVRDELGELPPLPPSLQPQEVRTPSTELIVNLAGDALASSSAGEFSSALNSHTDDQLDWWKAPASDFPGIKLSSEKFASSPSAQITSKFIERKTMFAGAPAIETTQTFDFNFERFGASAQEIYTIVSTDTSPREPLHVIFQRRVRGAADELLTNVAENELVLDQSLIEKLTPAMQTLDWTIARYNHQWKQTITVNGEVVVDTPCPAPAEAVYTLRSKTSIVQELQMLRNGQQAGVTTDSWKVTHAILDPFPVTETFHWIDQPSATPTGATSESLIRINRVRTKSPLLRYGSLLRDLAHRQFLQFDENGQVTALSIQLPPAYFSQEKNSAQEWLEHPHLRYMIETGRLSAAPEIAENQSLLEGSFYYMLPQTNTREALSDENRTKYYLDFDCVKTDQQLDTSRKLKSLELQFRFSNPPADDWATWGDLQQETTMDSTTRRIRILSPTDHLNKIAKPDSPWETEFCLLPTTFIQSDDRELVAYAAAIPKNDTLQLIQDLKEAATDRLNGSYRFVGKPLSAAEAFRLKEGACQETSFLMAALARARQIPARIVHGLMYDQETSQFIPHAWVELYVETNAFSGWYPCDPNFPHSVDARYVKLFHLADIDLPINYSTTPEGIYYASGVESIEVVEVEYGEVIQNAAHRSIQYVSALGQAPGAELPEAEPRRRDLPILQLNAALFAVGLLSHADEDDDTVASDHVFLPEFAAEFGLIVPNRIQRPDGPAAFTRHLWLFQEAVPSLTLQLQATHGPEVANAFRLPFLIHFVELSTQHGEDPTATHAAIRLLFNAGQAIGLSEDSSKGFEQRLTAWQQTGNPDETLAREFADTVMENIVAQAKESIQTELQQMRSQLELDSGNVGLRLIFAKQLIVWGQFTEALEVLEPIGSSAAVPSEARFLLGLCALHQKRWRLAATEFTAVLKNDPKHVETLVHLAWLCRESSQPEEARTLLETTLELNPQHPLTLYHLADFYAQQNDQRKALDFAKQTLNLAPWHRPAIMLMIRLLSNDPESEQAKIAFLVEQLNTTGVYIFETSECLEGLALLSAVSGDFESAIQHQISAKDMASLLQLSRLERQLQAYRHGQIQLP